jgi:heme-degrading monooxygenase HmoA
LKARREYANPFSVEEEEEEDLHQQWIKKEEKKQEHVALQSAAYRWELIIGFAGEELFEAMQASEAETLTSEMGNKTIKLLPVSTLNEARELLPQVRWGQNTLPTAELLKDAQLCRLIQTTLSF